MAPVSVTATNKKMRRASTDSQQNRLTISLSSLKEFKSEDSSRNETLLSSKHQIFKPQSASMHRPMRQTVTRDLSSSIPRPKTTAASFSSLSNIHVQNKQSPGGTLTSRRADSKSSSTNNNYIDDTGSLKRNHKPPLIINVYPSLPNRFTYESDDLAHYLNVLKACKQPLYPITNQEQDKRKQVYSTLAFIMSAFQYHDKIVHSSVEPDEHSIQNVSYGHPQDLFQVCCYLLRENLSYTSEIDHLKSQMVEKDRKIEEFHKKYESKNDHDLVKLNPSQNDLNNLEESVSKLEQDIYHHDPILYKEIIEKTEEEDLLHSVGAENIKDQFLNTKDAVPRLPSLIRNSDNTKSFQKKKNQKKEDSHTEKYTKCLQYKMKLLENLIFVLKKKVQRYEQSDSDIRKLVKNWGTLPELLKENETMKKELNFYNWVTQRFDTELLLKHKYLYLDDVYMLRSVIFALQNELYVAQIGLSKYNEIQNKILKIMTTDRPEEMTSKHNTLEYLMTELFMTDKQKFEYEKKKEAKRMVAEENNKTSMKEEAEPSMIELKNKLRSLEHENKFLTNQVSRLENQVTDLNSAMELLREDVTGERKVEIKERETMIRKLSSRIDQLNKTASDREVYFLFQQQLVQELTNKRDTLFEENSETNDRLINARNNVVSLRTKLEHQSKGLNVMFQITSSLLHYFMKTQGKKLNDKLSPENNVKIMFGDVFSAYIIQMNACVRIQSWFRGIQKRKKLLEAEKHAPFVQKMLSKQRNTKAYAKKPVESKSPPEPPLFSIFTDFLKVISTNSQQSTEMLQHTNGLIQAFKQEIVGRFKSKIQEELEQCKKETAQTSDYLLSTLKDVVLKPKSERACQTEKIENKSRGVQNGVSQVSNVELRK